MTGWFRLRFGFLKGFRLSQATRPDWRPNYNENVNSSTTLKKLLFRTKNPTCSKKTFSHQGRPFEIRHFKLGSFETTLHKSLNLVVDREPFIQFGIIFTALTYQVEKHLL